jgi:rhamnulokinase
MSPSSNYLAIDLGAESGRAVVGRFDGSSLALSTLHRFPNGPVRALERMHWDVLRLHSEIKASLSRYRQEVGSDLVGIGVDTWGVDFGLLGRDDGLLSNPRHYRDPRTEGMLAEAFRRVPREAIFAATGAQFMEINSLYQLLAMKLQGDPVLDSAQALLMMPDLFNFWLTGVKVCEFSAATTTQFYDPRARDWARPLLEALELPTHILQPIVSPGTVLGPLHPTVAEETGLESVSVIAPACHDTGSAVAAVPARSPDVAYISSGTWSLMGVETPEPVIGEESLAYNFTNEGGVCATIRLLKNIMGLWLVQECRRTWAHEGDELSYDELTRLAAEAPAFGPLIEPDCLEFLRPGDMPTRIQSFCRRTGQRVPETKGEIIRCSLESLALKYRWALEKLEAMVGKRLETIHVVGGGSQNRLLCQLTADAAHRLVVGGPVEATATGNILMQALAKGEIASLAEGREVVRHSFETLDYEPYSSGTGSAADWDEAYARFIALRQEVADVQ